MWVRLFLVVQSCLFTEKCMHAYVPKTTWKRTAHSCGAHSLQDSFSSQFCLPKFSVSRRSVPGRLSPLLFLVFPGFQPLKCFQQPACFPQHLQPISSGQVLVPNTLKCNVLCKFLTFWAAVAFRGCFSLSIWLGEILHRLPTVLNKVSAFCL